MAGEAYFGMKNITVSVQPLGVAQIHVAEVVAHTENDFRHLGQKNGRGRGTPPRPAWGGLPECAISCRLALWVLRLPGQV